MTQAIPVEELLGPLQGPPGSAPMPCGSWGDEQDGFLQGLLDAVANPLEVVRRQVVQDGETAEVVELKPKKSSDPGWNQVLDAALCLFRGGLAEFEGRSLKTPPSKHLGVATVLTLAAIEVHGLVGLADGFELLRGLMDRYWDSVHPLPTDGEYFRRSNQIRRLQGAWGDLNDGWRVLQRFAQQALLVSDRDGPIPILLAVRSAPGVPIPGLPPGDPIPIGAVESLKALNSDAVAGARESVDRAIRSVEGVVSTLRQKAGDDAGIRFEDLLAVLKALAAFLTETKPAAVVAQAVPSPTGSTSIAPTERLVTSRQDAIEALASVAQYLRSSDPASPVPELLEQVSRTVGKRFGQLLRDLGLGDSASAEFDRLAGSFGRTNESGVASPESEAEAGVAPVAHSESSLSEEILLASGLSADKPLSVQQQTPTIQMSGTASWEIHSQVEVIRVLGAVSGYFLKHEPASPAPPLIQRAVGLVGRDFPALLLHLFPQGDGAARFRALSGVSEPASSSPEPQGG